MKLSLHSHTREGSWDASLTDAEMTAVYHEYGIVSAVTDHDVMTPTDRIVGEEQTVDAGKFIHVVELPAYDFHFLAHPGRIRDSRGTKDLARDLIEAHNLDGVEKYSQGVRQYEGSIDGVVELANDDAHNGFQVGLSYMTVDADTTPEAIEAVRRGEATLHNEPGGRVVGKVRQAAELGPKKLRRRCRRPSRRKPL